MHLIELNVLPVAIFRFKCKCERQYITSLVGSANGYEKSTHPIELNFSPFPSHSTVGMHLLIKQYQKRAHITEWRGKESREKWEKVILPFSVTAVCHFCLHCSNKQCLRGWAA